MRTARSRPLMIAVVGVLVVVAAGAAFAVATDRPDTPVSSGPITGNPPDDTWPVVVEPRPGMADVYARPFDTATVAEDDTTVTIDFMGGVEPCSVLDRVEVRTGASTVTITLFEGRDPNAGDVACIEIGVLKRVVVQLDEPVAGRAIADGAS